MLSSMLGIYSTDFILYGFTICPAISLEDAIYIYTELFNASDADLDSNNKPNVYPLFYNLITKGTFLFTGALLGVCIGPGFFPMEVLA